MSIEKFILNVATHYHANLIDIHNALHALGLRSDEQAEEFNKKHVMDLVNMYKRRGYDITKKWNQSLGWNILRLFSFIFVTNTQNNSKR